MELVENVYDRIDEEWARVVAAWEEEHGAEFPCKAGCSDCCKTSVEGLPYISMPMSQAEGEYLLLTLHRQPEFRREMLKRRKLGGWHHACLLLLGDGRCMAYEARPLWCRVFGLFGGSPACGRIPANAGADPQWLDAVSWAFGQLLGEELVDILELVNRL